MAKRQATQAEERFEKQIERKARRKLRAAREDARPLWFWLGMFGLIGWSIAIPTLAGIALGWWIDSTWPGEISWTLTFLLLGVVLGCLNAWYWIRQEHRQ